HCCGSVHEVLPLMIDCGIDIFNVVQTSAKNMQLEILHRLYSKDICFCGALDSQSLLISKKPGDIINEVKKIKELWTNNGGMILGPSHNMVPDTPIANILAIYDAIGINR
ncbi:MAG: hypothetical protein M1409_11150, partial [Actinobacteria bacterium]|nr:hypothetical protein [Actinomycetota bacterium]